MASPRKSLDARPDATSFQVDDLLAAVSRGRVRLPRFQRAFRWEPRDRLDLFDSIMRGFPIGTMLLWKRPAPVSTIEIGRFRVDASSMPDALWVVDGQQRLTTLVEALLVTGENQSRPLIYNLEEKAFAFSPRRILISQSAEIGSSLVPLSHVLDAKRLARWCSQSGMSDDAFDQALELGKRIREYRVPAYVLETDDREAIRSIFDRTNRTGKRLTAVEVFDALFGAFDPDEDDPLEALERSEATSTSPQGR